MLNIPSYEEARKRVGPAPDCHFERNTKIKLLGDAAACLFTMHPIACLLNPATTLATDKCVQEKASDVLKIHKARHEIWEEGMEKFIGEQKEKSENDEL